MRLRWIGLFLGLLFWLPTGAHAVLANPGQEIVGRWQFYKVILDGVERPPFNPDLIIEFEFFADGTDRLRWWRTNERGFCERNGRYAFDGKQLRDKVTWVHPDNNFDCGRDPDMQLGRETLTPAEIKNGDLHLSFAVGDQTLVYVWRMIEPEPAPDKYCGGN